MKPQKSGVVGLGATALLAARRLAGEKVAGKVLPRSPKVDVAALGAASFMPVLDGGRIRGPLELQMDRDRERRVALRELRWPSRRFAFPRLRRTVEPAQDTKRARKAAGISGRKAAKRFYAQFKRGGAAAGAERTSS